MTFRITAYIDYDRGNNIVEEKNKCPQMANKAEVQFFCSLKLAECDCHLSLRLSGGIGSWLDILLSERGSRKRKMEMFLIYLPANFDVSLFPLNF